jgi:hypothetical protein
LQPSPADVSRGQHAGTARFLYRKENIMLLVLAILILILALGGGIFISKFLFLLLLIALIVALFSRRTV